VRPTLRARGRPVAREAMRGFEEPFVLRESEFVDVLLSQDAVSGTCAFRTRAPPVESTDPDREPESTAIRAAACRSASCT